MSLHIPSFAEALNVARGHGCDSEAPQSWNSIKGLWPIATGGGPTAFDLSGYGNDGTLTGMDPATDWVTSRYGYALDFDGANDYIHVPTAVASAYPITMSAWVKRAASADMSIAQIHDGTSGSDNAFRFYIDSNDKLNIRTRSDGVHGTIITSTGSVATEWTHVAGVFESDTAGRLYIDGALDGSGAFNKIPGAVTLTFLGTLRASVWPFNGLVASVAIHARTLPGSEIQQLYADPHAMFRLRRRVYATAVAAVGNPWHYYQQQTAGAA